MTRDVQRNPIEGSSPKAIKNLTKTGNPALSKSFKEALSDIRMTIVPENYLDRSTSQKQAEFIRNYTLQKLEKLDIGGLKPRFSVV